MIADWQTNSIYFSECLKSDKRYENAFKRILSSLENAKITHLLLPNTKDIWARDYMPIQVSENKFIEYRYDPDYLQGDSDMKKSRELKTYPDIVCDSIGLKTTKCDIILDGGNIVKSENSIILTDKIVWENKRSYSKKELISKLHDAFGAEQVIIIPWDDVCEFGHADGMLRFINNDTVLISGFYEQIDEESTSNLLKPLQKAKLNIEWLKSSKNEAEENIGYINFLQTKDILLLPAFNQSADSIAFSCISKYFPEYASKNRIIQIDVREITKYSGALNCVSWTIKKDLS